MIVTSLQIAFNLTLPQTALGYMYYFLNIIIILLYYIIIIYYILLLYIIS